MIQLKKWDKIGEKLFSYYLNDKIFIVQTHPFKIVNINKLPKGEELDRIINEIKNEPSQFNYGSYYLPLFIGTTSCNFQCKYCYADNGSYGEDALFINNEVIDRTIVFLSKKMESMLRNNINDKTNIELGAVFFGGESLLNFRGAKYLVNRMIALADSLNKKSSVRFKPLIIINTNGSIFTHEILDFLIDNKEIVEVVVSFDGLHHDKYRTYAGNNPTSANVINGIRMIKKSKIKYTISCTVPPDEMEDIDNNIKYITKLFGKNTEINLSFIRGAISQVKTRAIYPGKLESMYKEKSLRIFGRKVAELIKKKYNIFVKRFENRIAEGGYPVRCPAALYEFCVYPDGNVYPCHNFISDEFVLGNIKNKNFDPINNSKIINQFKSRLVTKIKCKDCIFQSVCLSSFDCPSHSLYDIGDFYEVDVRTCAAAKNIMEALLDRFIQNKLK